MDIYPREQNVYGLNSGELMEAMKMYTDNIKEKIINDMENEFGIRFDIADESGEIRSYFKFAIDRAITEGMELVGDRYKLVDFYLTKKSKSAFTLVKTYEFEVNKGVSGVLFPDGVFAMCGNAEHNIIMNEIPMEVQFGCLYFSSMMRGEGDGVITHSPVKFNGITSNQLSWMELNFDYFDRGQQRRAHFDWDVRKDD